jgi:hypothetical protein
MPNGESRNWIRLLSGIENFYAAYGHWPVRVFVYPFFVQELRQMMKPGEFDQLNSKIELIPEQEATFRYEDHQGRSYDYGHESAAQKFTKPNALKWLNVSEPDYSD